MLTDSYTVLYIVGLLAGMLVTEQGGHPRSLYRRIYIVGTLGAVAGARLFYGLQYGAWGTAGGMSLWGYTIGGTAAVIATLLFLKLRTGKWQALGFADAVAPALALGVAVQRIGCYLHGCCYGKVCSLPWAVTYPPGTNAFNKHLREGLINASSGSSLPIHPTQLYETFLGFLAFAVLLVIRRARSIRLLRFEMLLGLALYYAIVRFLLEFLRDDAGGRAFGPLTFSQGIAVLISIVAATLLTWRRIQFARKT